MPRPHPSTPPTGSGCPFLCALLITTIHSHLLLQSAGPYANRVTRTSVSVSRHCFSSHRCPVSCQGSVSRKRHREVRTLAQGPTEISGWRWAHALDPWSGLWAQWSPYQAPCAPSIGRLQAPGSRRLEPGRAGGGGWGGGGAAHAVGGGFQALGWGRAREGPS